MPRPRTVSDVDLLDGALRVMRRTGPDGVTFQSVASETGLAAATLVQRFGSKADLLRAVLLRAWDHLDEATEAADVTAPATVRGSVEFLVALSADYGEGDPYDEGLLVLREDMRDPMLRRRGVAWEKRLIAAVGRRLGPKGRPRHDLGRLMVAQWQGAILWWGFRRDGRLPSAVRSALLVWLKAVGKVA